MIKVDVGARLPDRLRGYGSAATSALASAPGDEHRTAQLDPAIHLTTNLGGPPERSFANRLADLGLHPGQGLGQGPGQLRDPIPPLLERGAAHRRRQVAHLDVDQPAARERSSQLVGLIE